MARERTHKCLKCPELGQSWKPSEGTLLEAVVGGHSSQADGTKGMVAGTAWLVVVWHGGGVMWKLMLERLNWAR